MLQCYSVALLKMNNYLSLLINIYFLVCSSEIVYICGTL